MDLSGPEACFDLISFIKNPAYIMLMSDVFLGSHVLQPFNLPGLLV